VVVEEAKIDSYASKKVSSLKGSFGKWNCWSEQDPGTSSFYKYPTFQSIAALS
jgi:hypothetical protein